MTTKQQIGDFALNDSPALRRQLGRCLEGEEAFGLSIFGDVGSGQVKISNIMGGNAPIGVDAMPIGILMRVFIFSDDLAVYRGSMEKFRSLAMTPYFQAKPDLDLGQWDGPNLRYRAPLTSLVLPALSRLFFNCARTEARQSAASGAVAMTRYRVDHGAYPAKLADLAPDYLDDIPIDPFDGKPLRYVIHGDEAIIYSVGPDTKDDGGAAFDPKHQTGDITFRLTAAKKGSTTRP